MKMVQMGGSRVREGGTWGARRRGEKEEISRREEKGDRDSESGGGACAGGSGTLFVVQLPPRVSVNYELPVEKVRGYLL